MSVFTENPVLHKELVTRFLLRRQSRANRIAIYTLLGLILPLVYFFMIRSMLRDPSASRDAFGIFVSVLEVSVVVLLTPAMAAGAISLEREKQTWNALLISKLEHREIVVGKYLGAIFPTVATLALLFPLNVFAALVGKVSFGLFVLAHALLITTALFYGALGLFCSWAARRTQVATAATAGTIAVLVLGTPLALMLWQAVTPYSSAQDPVLAFPPLWLNPYAAMLELLGDASHSQPQVAVFCSVASALGALLLLLAVTRNLAKGPKEMSA